MVVSQTCWINLRANINRENLKIVLKLAAGHNKFELPQKLE